MTESAEEILISFLLVSKNEKKYIGKCLLSMLNQTIDPKTYEIVIVDGLSTDGTREIIQKFISAHPNRNIILFDNPKEILSSGWNIGIRESHGKYLIRPDAHADVPADFLERNLAVARAHPEVWAVGGVLKTIGSGFWGQTIAGCLSSRMGVGGSRFRVGGRSGPADTIVFGLYKRDKLLKIGGFDETILLNQDNLCHSKIDRHGGVLYFDPSIKSTYFCRDSLRSLWKQMFKRSIWLMRMLKHPSGRFLSIRYVIPLLFLLAMFTLVIAGFFNPLLWWIQATVLAGYVLFSWLFSTTMPISIWQKICTPVVFLVTHAAYGIGSLLGLLTLPWYQPEEQMGLSLVESLSADYSDSPMVSVILPVLNESEYIENCVRSLMNGTYDREKIEILVFDGGSTDDTRQIVSRLTQEFPQVRLLDNPKKFISPAFNHGIKIARGEIIIRFDGHSEASKDYIQRNVEVLKDHPDAWSVGGPVETVSKNKIGKIIAAAMSCPIGVGNAYFRLGSHEGYVDTVMYGAYRKEGLVKVGPVDEFLLRTEDDDLHFRIRKAGGKFYLSQKIKSIYYCRAGLSKLWNQYFQYGYWRIPTIMKHHRPAVVRQIVPVSFVLGWIALIAGSFFWNPLQLPLLVCAGLYTLILLAGAVLAIKKNGFGIGIATMLIFPILHFSYGLGSLAGIWRFVIMQGKGVGPVNKTKITR